MDIPHLVLLLTVMLLIGVVIDTLTSRLYLPFYAVLVVTGFAFSEIITGMDVDLGLRWHHFHDLVMFVFLPVLIFESALRMDPDALRRNLGPILVLAGPVMLLSAGLTTILLYYGIGDPVSFPWMAALLASVLLSATDPAAVLRLFERVGAPKQVALWVDGESLFNDVFAIVLFQVVLTLAVASGSVRVAGAALEFFHALGTGIAVGGGAGLLAAALFRWLRGTVVHAVISVITAYLAFVVAADLLSASGVMAVLAAGLTLGTAARRLSSQEERHFLHELWAFNAYVAGTVLFLLMGMTVTTVMFSERWLAMVFGVIAVLAARAIAVYTLLPAASRLPGGQPVDRLQQTVLYWGGLRGAVTLALALALPLELDYWFTVQSIAYGVVLFTLFVNAPTMPLLLRRLNARDGSD